MGCLTLLALVLSAAEPQLLTAAEARALIGQLAPQVDRAAKLQALNTLQARGDEQAELLLPALARCIRDDPLPEVRQRAVNALAHVAHRLGRPCPLAVVQALFDRDEQTRWQAAACTPFFKNNFESGCAEVLLRGTDHANDWIRLNCIMHLPLAASQDRRTRAAIDKALRDDKTFAVRHMAHWALFRIDDKLDEMLPYLIRLREEPAAFVTTTDGEQRKQDQAEFNMYLLGSMLQYRDWIEQRGPELAKLLLKQLDSKDPLQRRGAASLIAYSAQKPEPPHRRKSFLLEELEDKVQKPSAAPPQPSQTYLELKKLGAVQRLTALRDQDPDMQVRAAVCQALESLNRFR